MRKNTIEPTEENLQTWRQDYGVKTANPIEVKHHQALAQLKLFLKNGYRIHRALEIVTEIYNLSTNDIAIIQAMDLPFVLAN